MSDVGAAEMGGRRGGAALAVAWALALSWATPAPVRAQELQLTRPLAGAPAVYKLSASDSKQTRRIVMPSRHLELAGEIAFLMSKRSPFAEQVELTDLALLRLNLRRSVADWLEVSGGPDLLPKQPSATHASVFQGAHLGAQAEVASGFGTAMGIAVGPLFGVDGVFYRGGPGMSWKVSSGEYLRFVVGAGNAWTVLDYRPRPAAAFWLGEIVTHAETQMGDQNASMWVGVNYAVPFVSRPRARAADPERGYLDPQVRLNLEAGGSLSLHSDDWNVYASYTIVDRGELDKPETTLPILDGGFDQHQIAIGVQYHFEPRRARSDPAW